MTETLEQIRKLIVDGKFLEALNMIDDQIANASKKVERDADHSKTMENLRKMLEDECSRRCVLEDENNELKKEVLYLKFKIQKKDRAIESYRHSIIRTETN